jgi:hypothetical protein
MGTERREGGETKHNTVFPVSAFKRRSVSFQVSARMATKRTEHSSQWDMIDPQRATLQLSRLEARILL